MFKRPAYVIVTSILLTATLLAVTVSSCHPVSASQNQEPIEIVSVLGPLRPINWGGPRVEITLKNLGVEPVISLTATLEPATAFDTSFDFTFDDVSPSNPLQPNTSTSDTLTLIGGGFSSDVSYPLTINATLQNGGKFVYTKLVQIVPVSTSQNWEPIEIVSVLGPVPPFTPGGPGVEITLKNVSVEPVISLTATLELSESFDFTFDDVSPSNPLQPNASTSDTLTLIGGGFSSDVSYPLTINATLRNGAKFIYTKLVQIIEPPLNIGGIFAIRSQIWGLALVGAICALFQPHVAVLAILPIIFVYLSKSDL